MTSTTKQNAAKRKGGGEIYMDTVGKYWWAMDRSVVSSELPHG